MRRIIPLAIPLLLSLATPSWGVDDDVDQYVAIHVGKLIVGNGEERKDVTVLILDGKIEAVGKDVDLPHPCREIDARGWTAMPGLIHPSSRRGLLGINRGGTAAHRTISEEFLPAEGAYDGAVEAGFTTMVLSPPSGNGFPGRAMTIRTKDLGAGLIIEPESWVRMSLDSSSRYGSAKGALRKGFTDAKKEIEKVEKARKEWEEKKKKAEEEAKKKAEAEKKKGGEPEKKTPQAPPKPGMAEEGGEKKKEDKPKEPEVFKAPPMNPALVPLVKMIQGEDDIFGVLSIGGASAYLHMRDALRDIDVPYVLMKGGGQRRFGGSSDDLFFVADKMGERKETILLPPSISNYPYSINKVNPPQKFMDAGCSVGFFPSGADDNTLEGFRFQTAELLKAGTEREDAIKAMTLNVATALGLGDRLGSIEKGKDANLVLLNGDVFDVQAEVQQVVLEGEVVYDRDDEEED